MHWCGLLIVALAACSTADSVDIQIHGDRTVVHVELFVAGTPCTNCDGIAPPSASSKPSGKVNYLVGADRFYAATDGDNVAGFRLKPDGTNSTVPKLAAIGYDANDMPVGFVVDDTPFDLLPILGTKRRYELTLQPVSQVMPHPSTTEQVVTWRTEATDHVAPSCLAFLNHDGSNEFFVPEADPDCDGFLAAEECDPTWYKYTQPPDTNPAACLVDDNGACQVGRSGTCVDGATAPTCTSIDKVCVPQLACDTCMPPYNPTCLATIAIDASVPRLHCKFPVFHSTADNSLATCTNTSTNVVLNTVFPNNCNAGLATVQDPAVDPNTMIDISTANSEVVGYLKRTSTGIPCTVGFSPFVTVTSIPIGPLVAKGVFAVSTGGTETLLLPIVVEFYDVGPAATCNDLATNNECEILPDVTTDSIWSCAVHH